MEHIQKIRAIAQLTRDVKCIRIDKPHGYKFIPGQATEVAINRPGWEHEKRPFTFTSLNDDPYLEFIIKSYSDHDGVTNQIASLQVGDELIIDDPRGAIAYRGEGYFIAGGAGITPFIAILRQLAKDGQVGYNRLFFTSRTPADIIHEKELKDILGINALFIVTEKGEARYTQDFIDETFIDIHVSEFHKPFYICGPDAMINTVSAILINKGAKPDAVVFEK